MLRRHGYAACGLVALLGLAGCTGGGDDPPVSTSTSSTTTTPSAPSTTRTTTTSGPADGYPAAARAHTVEGGKAFVEYYYATLNEVFQRPRVGVIPGIAATSCVFCQRNEQSVKDLVAGGGKYSTPPLALKNLAPLQGAPKGQLYYQATSAQLGAWVVDGGGKKVHQDKVSSLEVSIAIVWANGSWKLYGADKA
ncbi:DUF6318 family protein [Pedococcus bigeumensis]|uniref:DUF6318 family protein n=1 Tax=Pedococcus bigeumensis TaxID=433644 RepID=UPI00112D032C|nr:DUF6318 family protein [Pedococcus bigeumensis]